MLRAMASDATSFFDQVRQRAADWLVAWDGQGIHRTATAGDNTGAEWLAREASTLGAEVTIEEFALERLDPITVFLEIGATRIEAVPVFDAPITDAAGVNGRLGLLGGDAEIAVAERPVYAVYSGEYERVRRTGGHRALVILCAGESPGLALSNAQSFGRPYGAPAIQVSSEAREAVLAAAAQGAPARLVAESRRTPARGRNVVVSLGGTSRTGPPLVVMTPRSSWWQSTAERGGGIVCWLESLRALVETPPARRVLFTANSGHELGHLGLDDFVARRPGWDRPQRDGGATWVLYGADIGTAGGILSIVSPADDLRALTDAELAQAGQSHVMAPKDLVPRGETRDIHRAGGHCLALNGTSRWFHLPQDRWPETVDLDAVTRIAAAGARIVTALTRG
jgi:hypothetical protein